MGMVQCRYSEGRQSDYQYIKAGRTLILHQILAPLAYAYNIGTMGGQIYKLICAYDCGMEGISLWTQSVSIFSFFKDPEVILPQHWGHWPSYYASSQLYINLIRLHMLEAYCQAFVPTAFA